VANFKLTKQSLENLGKEGIPDNVLGGLQLIENQGFTNKEDFLNAIKKQIGNKQTVRYEELILKHADYVDSCSPEHVCIRDIYQLKLLFDESEFEQAQALSESILTRKNISPEHRVETLILLGNIKIRLGHIGKSIADFKQAVDISKPKELPIWRIKSLNGLGYAHRLMGNFDRARDYYKQARHLCLAEGGPDKEELRDDYGWILNNLAYVLSNNKKTRQVSIDTARSVIEHWQSIGNNIGLGAGYLSLGITYYRSDVFALALENFQKALDIFEPLKHHDWLGQIYSWRGALYHHTLEPESNQKALQDLKKALEIGSTNIRPMTLSRLARAYMSRQQWEQAGKRMKESLELAQKMPDNVYRLIAVGRLATIAAEQRQYDRLNEFERMLKETLENISDPDKSSLGMAYIGLAKLAIGQDNPNNIETIVTYLREGITRIIDFGPFVSTDIFKRLHFVEKDFDNINPEIIRSIGQQLKKFFSEKEIEEIAYSAVAPIMYRWADWKREEKTHEE